jgi:hypothetical protein
MGPSLIGISVIIGTVMLGSLSVSSVVCLTSHLKVKVEVVPCLAKHHAMKKYPILN